LINELNDNMMTYISRNRYSALYQRKNESSLPSTSTPTPTPTPTPSTSDSDSEPETDIVKSHEPIPVSPSEALAMKDHVKTLSQSGPYTANLAVSNGLLNGTCYRQDILDSLLDPEFGGDSSKKLMGFYHYSKVVEKAMEKYLKEAIDVGVVYLMGTIGDPGEFGTADVVRGLKEAGEDDSIGAVVLRIDSGGGGVTDSDTIWGAVRDLRERKGKTVVASFGNASASGGYLVSTHMDAIFAARTLCLSLNLLLCALKERELIVEIG